MSLESLINELLSEKATERVTDPESGLVTETKVRAPNSLEIRAAKTIYSLHQEIQLLVNKNAENRNSPSV